MVELLVAPFREYWAWMLGAAIVTAVGIEAMVRWGRHRLMDMPNARSSHATPTPRGGGLPVILIALIGWIAAWYSATGRMVALPLVAGALLVGLVSWFDDLKGLPFRVRILVHLAATTLVLSQTGVPTHAPLAGIGDIPLGLLAWPLAVIWIVGFTNAFNFMDGINGIAGGQGLVAALAWVLLGADTPLGLDLLAALLVVALLVFLVFNWSPARIFMGDVGSAPLGFLFAVLPFYAGSVNSYSSVWVVGSAIVWPFVFDSGFTLVRRWRRGEKLTDAHRSHLYQRLVIAGWSHARTSLLYITWAVTTAIAGLSMAMGYEWSGPAGLSWAVLSGVLVWQLTLRVESHAAPPRS